MCDDFLLLVITLMGVGWLLTRRGAIMRELCFRGRGKRFMKKAKKKTKKAKVKKSSY